jgi:hypothetical protein
VVVPAPSLNPYAAARLVDVPAGNRVMEAVAEVPLSDAVIVAAWLVLTEPAAALNAAVELPAPTVTEAGTVKMVLLSESETLEPPVGAACVKVTVQADVELATTLLGEHCTAETAGVADWIAIVPPVPETAIAVPSAATPTRPLTDSGTLEPLVAASVTATVATLPLPITLLFMPLARHVVDPVPPLQRTVFPAAVKAAPAVTLTEVTSLEL